MANKCWCLTIGLWLMTDCCLAGTIDSTKLVTYQKYDFVNDSVFGNLIFPGRHKFMDVFNRKLKDAVTNPKAEKITILHIGGSHVQDGRFSNQMRTHFCELSEWARGDRGLLFPFKAMKTNAPADYIFSANGKWKNSRCISKTIDAHLGIAGAAIISDSTDCSLKLDLMNNGKWTFSDVRLLGYPNDDNTVPYIIVDNDTILYDKDDKKTGFLFHMTRETNTCRIGFDGNGKFTVRGMMPMSTRHGITYTESGVNGAATASWLHCDDFDEEMALMIPDMVIFGIGINDAASPDFKADRFKENYRKLIAKFRKLNPDVMLIFITNNDCCHLRTKRYNSNTPIAEQAFTELAQEYDGAVFDVFQLMGGPHSAETWVQNKLMEPDRVHFTGAGYRLLGDILFNAIIKTSYQYPQP